MDPKVKTLIDSLKAKISSLQNQKATSTKLILEDTHSPKLLSALKEFTQSIGEKIDKLISIEEREPVERVEKEIKVTNLKDLPAPIVKIPPFPTEMDISEPTWFKRLISPLVEGIKGVEFKWPTDPKNPVAVRLSDGEKFINQLKDSVSHVMTSGSSGSAATVQELQVINSLVPNKYDYVAVTTPTATQEVYTFRLGGVAGSVASTVTINYTDSTKVTLLNISKA